ncbi:MAG: UbiA prenyltransferase family protein [Selenomonadaceae bacterium]|nr:UbiA prenyltransferase family protein [Selenomonadaceae bacterium]
MSDDIQRVTWSDYIRIMRLDHWIKQLFILPGIITALALTDDAFRNVIIDVLCGGIAASLVASANYVINEYLDAKFDQFHPTKKHRSIVGKAVRGQHIFCLWSFLTAIGFILAWRVNLPFLIACIALWVMGIIYNVRPIRTKDIPILDVLSESLNNGIRFLLGWFIVTANNLPPVSVLLGYWLAGAFLMAIKRYAEYIMIGDAAVAGKYRQSFTFYTERSLLISAFFYAMLSVFFIGIFLIKYRLELLLFMPFFIGIFCYYFYLAFQEDSAVQKPEKIYRQPLLMLYCLGLTILFCVLMKVDIPWLSIFADKELIGF